MRPLWRIEIEGIFGSHGVARDRYTFAGVYTINTGRITVEFEDVAGQAIEFEFDYGIVIGGTPFGNDVEIAAGRAIFCVRSRIEKPVV